MAIRRTRKHELPAERCTCAASGKVELIESWTETMFFGQILTETHPPIAICTRCGGECPLADLLTEQ